jgi:Fe2+ or Zn2+ uptake regulation protein
LPSARRTALRDINALLAQGVLRKAAVGGRSTHYELNESSADPVVAPSCKPIDPID